MTAATLRTRAVHVRPRAAVSLAVIAALGWWAVRPVATVPPPLAGGILLDLHHADTVALHFLADLGQIARGGGGSGRVQVLLGDVLVVQAQQATVGTVRCPPAVFAQAEVAHAVMVIAGSTVVVGIIGFAMQDLLGNVIAGIAIDAAVADRNLMGWTHWAYKQWQDPTTADDAQGMFRDDAVRATGVGTGAQPSPAQGSRKLQHGGAHRARSSMARTVRT